MHALIAKQSSHYAQAHALLNLQLIHASPSLSAGESDDTEGQAAGFGIYSPLTSSGTDQSAQQSHDFTPEQLLLVSQRLLDNTAVPYFPLCRELGARAVDGLIRGRILDLRWVDTVTSEFEVEQNTTGTGPILLPTTPVIRAAMRQVVEEWKGYSSQATQSQQE